MSDISDLTAQGLPSASTLVKASVAALLIAAAILVLFVLPAEFGIDPTGVGRRLGIKALSTHASATGRSSVPHPSPVWNRNTPYRSDELFVTLAPNKGAEIKALMRAGGRFVFSWSAEGGSVNFDLHGEEVNAGKDEFTSYLKGKDRSSGHGEFVAPFDGNHGWYWRNRSDRPITVRVKTSGYYEKLFRP